MINLDFKSKLEIIEAFPNEDSCIKHLEALRWNKGIVSPFFEGSKVYWCANHKYRCKNSGKYFNVKTGTIFHDTKIDLQKWFLAVWILSSSKNSVSSVSLSQELNITQKTTWYMMKRIKSISKAKIKNLNISAELYDVPPNEPQIIDSSLSMSGKLQMLQWLELLNNKQDDLPKLPLEPSLSIPKETLSAFNQNLLQIVSHK